MVLYNLHIPQTTSIKAFSFFSALKIIKNFYDTKLFVDWKDVAAHQGNKKGANDVGQIRSWGSGGENLTKSHFLKISLMSDAQEQI